MVLLVPEKDMNKYVNWGGYKWKNIQAIERMENDFHSENQLLSPT